MRRLILVVLFGVAASCAKDEAVRVGAGGKVAPGHDISLPSEIEWKDGPPALPAGAKFAVLEGDPSKPGYFAMRLKLPDGYRIPPHWHPVEERVTVISGTFRLGMGDVFEPGGLREMPPGSYAHMPPGMRHYAAAEGETVLQLATAGPWGITYVNAADDPRQKK